MLFHNTLPLINPLATQKQHFTEEDNNSIKELSGGKIWSLEGSI